MHRFTTYLSASILLLFICSFQVRAAEPEEIDCASGWQYAVFGASDMEAQTKPSHPDATLVGIDVSHHQGEIDWETVAASDVDFVIIRCGFGMDQTDQDDRQFQYNVSECERLGIPYGIYLYSYATDTARAQSEAEHVLRLINGRKLSYPIYYDLEDHSIMDSDLAAIASVFCGQIQAAGYPVGVYSNVYWWENYLTDPCFEQWYRWVAHYNPTCEYEGSYQLWQFSSKGTVAGISTNVDMNYQIGYPQDHGTGVFFHAYTAEVTESTCTAPGYTVFTCSDCGNSYTACYKGTTAHNWDAGSVVRPSTCSEAGRILHTCVDCGATRQNILPLEQHSIQEAVCTVCGADALTRLAGDNRYETSFAVAEQLKKNWNMETFETVIVACGTNYADALAGSYLAVQTNAPILLVNKHTIHDVKNYIAENLADKGTVYLLGGTAAVPAEMETALEGCTVKRLAGTNRYETNLKILEEAGTAGREILVCTGRSFADSLSASAVNKPILLVNKSLTYAQKEFLKKSDNEFIIIGGESAVSAELEEELKAYGSVERISGANRYESSVKVAEYFFENPQSAVLAYAKNFPDGLCGGILAYTLKAPLILTAAKAEPAAAAYAKEHGIASGIVLGGEGLISGDVAGKIFG